MKIGINTLVDLDVAFPELLRQIAAAGFNHVSLSHDVAHAGYQTPAGRERIRRLFDEHQLKLDYIHMPLENFYDLSCPDEHTRKATVEIVKMSLAACSDLGGASVVVHACGREQLSDGELPAAVQSSIESLQELADFARERKVLVVVENLAANTAGQRVTLRVMHDPAMAELPLCIDPCHASIQSDDALELVRWMAPRVVATHFSDTMGGHDSHLIPGEGAVDYTAVERELGKAGYSGVVDLECSLWMQRLRKLKNQPHPGDTVPCSTEHYLEKAAAAARAIWENIDKAKRQTGEPA